MAGNDSNCLLLLHFDGTNGSTTFTDSSVGDGNSPHSYTSGGDAEIDTSESEFGGASLRIDEDAAIVSYANSTDWTFGTSDFTIDCWVRFTTLTNNTICARTTGSSSYLYWSLESGNTFRFRDYNSGNNIDIQASWTPTVNTWYHVAVVRSSGVITMYVNGTSLTNSTNTGPSNSFVVRTVTFDIGNMTQNASYYTHGWIDEFRVSNIARWTSNFTPPTSEYTNSGITFDASPLSITSTIYSPTFSYDYEKTVSPLSITSTIHSPLFVGPVIQFDASTLTITSTINSPTFEINVDKVVSPLTLTSTIYSPTFSYNHEISVSSLTATFTLQSPSISFSQAITNATAILSYNPLVIVTGNNPVQLAIVDVSIPSAPTWSVYTLIGTSNATAVTYNSFLGNLYVACANGDIVEIDASSPNTYSVLSTGSAYNLTSITSLPSFFDIFAGTNYNGGEIVTLYEGSSVSLSTDVRFSALTQTTFGYSVNTINGLTFATDFRWASIINDVVNCDIRFISEAFADLSITPISRPDFVVYINGIEITDVQLESIEITHAADEKSMATFILSRKHDALNNVLNSDGTLGISSPITGNPSVQITIQGHEEFGYDSPAYIWDIDCKSELEQVKIIAYSELPKQDIRNTVTLSLPSINEKLHVYHALVHNPEIDNPIILPDDPNPPFYLGILIDTGYVTVQNVKRFEGFSTAGQTEAQLVNYVFGSGDSGVYDLNANNIYFKPVQNWTYFWFGHGTNFTTGVTWTGLWNYGMSYLGTSPSSLTSTTWDVDFIDWYYQRQFPDTITRGPGESIVYNSDMIGVINTNVDFDYRDHSYIVYTGPEIMAMKYAIALKSNPYAQNPSNPNPIALNSSIEQYDTRFIESEYTTDLIDLIESKFGQRFGVGPWKKVSCKNGILTTSARWVDEADGLYLYTPQGYNYTDYVTAIGNLEYKKIQNINGSVLPKTKCDVEMFLDGYYHYEIALLQRLNIDNTTSPNIYNNQNGFPVSVKSIKISAKDMKVSLSCSNQWSRLELLEIESTRPDSSTYIIPESWTFITPKFDPNSLMETS